MKYQSLFSGKNKKNVTSWSSAKLAKRMVKVNMLITTAADGIFIIFFFIFYFFFFFFEKKKRLVISCILSSLIFSERRK